MLVKQTHTQYQQCHDYQNNNYRPFYRPYLCYFFGNVVSVIIIDMYDFSLRQNSGLGRNTPIIHNFNE